MRRRTGTAEGRTMNRYLAVVYGALSYTLFLVVFLYPIGFVGGLVPRSVDNAVVAPVGWAVLVDVVLVTLFALQHSVMARPAFKTVVDPHRAGAHRTEHLCAAGESGSGPSLWQWRELPAVVWDMTWQPARLAVWTLFWLGWAIVLASTFMINHFELFGLNRFSRRGGAAI